MHEQTHARTAVPPGDGAPWEEHPQRAAHVRGIWSVTHLAERVVECERERDEDDSRHGDVGSGDDGGYGGDGDDVQPAAYGEACT